MSDLPKSYSFYKNNPEYYDSYMKFFMFGDSKDTIPDDIKIYNKVGTAYGYLIDCAYIENTTKDIGFFLTAVIHVNKNKIYTVSQLWKNTANSFKLLKLDDEQKKNIKSNLDKYKAEVTK